MSRRAVNKRRDAKKFSKASRKTHPLNLAIQRGGFRL